jgi:hypothetical protein
MPFLTRNRYYLRVSSSKVIPLYVGSLLHRACRYLSDYIIYRFTWTANMLTGCQIRHFVKWLPISGQSGRCPVVHAKVWADVFILGSAQS